MNELLLSVLELFEPFHDSSLLFFRLSYHGFVDFSYIMQRVVSGGYRGAVEAQDKVEDASRTSAWYFGR